jgi:hypothetical protein
VQIFFIFLSLNLLEPFGPVQACNGIALPLPLLEYLVSLQEVAENCNSLTAIKLRKCVKIEVFDNDSNMPKLYLQGTLEQIKAGVFMIPYHSFQNMLIPLILSGNLHINEYAKL